MKFMAKTWEKIKVILHYKELRNAILNVFLFSLFLELLLRE
jgi:hypothetical protein